ncbi:MAG TPA: glutamate-cysteine ligase family protein, partial [Jatrophihabitans sp.]
MEIRSVGVEEELLLIDASQQRPTAVADRVVAHARRFHPGEDPPVERELKQEQIEIGSTATTSMPALHADLVRLRAAAARAAEAEGSTIVALATNPWKNSPSMTPTPRYERI